MNGWVPTVLYTYYSYLFLLCVSFIKVHPVCSRCVRQRWTFTRFLCFPSELEQSWRYSSALVNESYEQRNVQGNLRQRFVRVHVRRATRQLLWVRLEMKRNLEPQKPRHLELTPGHRISYRIKLTLARPSHPDAAHPWVGPLYCDARYSIFGNSFHLTSWKHVLYASSPFLLCTSVYAVSKNMIWTNESRVYRRLVEPK